MKQKSKYIVDLIKKHPEILSGRKNYNSYFKRIEKNLKLTKKYIKDKNFKTSYKKND